MACSADRALSVGTTLGSPSCRAYVSPYNWSAKQPRLELVDFGWVGSSLWKKYPYWSFQSSVARYDDPAMARLVHREAKAGSPISVAIAAPACKQAMYSPVIQGISPYQEASSVLYCSPSSTPFAGEPSRPIKCSMASLIIGQVRWRNDESGLIWCSR